MIRKLNNKNSGEVGRKSKDVLSLVLTAVLTMTMICSSASMVFAESGQEQTVKAPQNQNVNASQSIESGQSDGLTSDAASAGDNSSDSASISSSGNANAIRVYIDGNLVSFDVEPEIMDGTTYVPMRKIFEELGADISWSDERNEVVATLGLDEVILKIGSVVAIHNTEVTNLSNAPYIKDSRTMVPLRYLSESLNYNVQWDGSTRTISISSQSSGNSSTSSAQNSSYGEGAALSVLGENAGITYNTAMQKAIAHSSTCQSARLSLKQYETQLEEFNNMYSVNYSVTLMQSRKSLQLMNSWYQKNVVVSEEQTAYVATTDMDAISLKLIDIQNQKMTVEYAKKTYATNQIKYQNGMLSAKELKSSQDEVTAAEKKLAEYETELEGLYISFYGTLGMTSEALKNQSASSSVTGSATSSSTLASSTAASTASSLTSSSSTSKSSTSGSSTSANNNATAGWSPLEFKLNYEPIGEVNMQQSYNDALSNDPYIWLLEHTEENAQFVLDTYEYNQASKSYDLTKMDITQARQNLNASKTNLMTTLNSRYNQILQVENNIDMLEDQLETLRDGIDTLRTTYEAGVSTKQALEDALQNERTITYNLLSLKISHQQRVDIFEKPYLSPTYVVQ